MIVLLEGHTTELLDEVAKKKKKDTPSHQIGSWDSAVTVADGAWMTRGIPKISHSMCVIT